MIRLLHSNDWHVRGTSPEARKDDYPVTILRKVHDFFETGNKLGVDAFSMGGDMFDSPHTSSVIVTRLGKIIREGLGDKKLFGVWGNHDESGWNPKTVSYTPIGVMQEFVKNFIILSDNPYELRANGMSVDLTGVSSYAELDLDIEDKDGNTVSRARDWIVDHARGPHIHIVHGHLSPKPLLDTMRHTLIEEMRHTKACVTLGAHDHTGFPITKIDNGLVYNPGSLGRVKASMEEMNRMPKYALITIHDDGRPEIEPIPCSIAEPGPAVLDRSIIEAKREKEAKLKAARENMKEVLSGIDIKGVDLNVLVYAFKGQFPDEVLKETVKRLGL